MERGGARHMGCGGGEKEGWHTEDKVREAVKK